MKIKKKYSYTDRNQIWRIKITDSGKLLIESRNTDKKEAFFHCLELASGKSIFTNHQMEEKYWLGIEAIYNDLILFHKFAKPDMPKHQGMLAFDIDSKSTLWENLEYAFLFILENKIYSYQERFEGKQVYTIDPNSGKVIEDLGQNPPNLEDLKYLADSEIDYSHYKFPEFYFESTQNAILNKLIEKETRNLNLVGEIEYVIENEFLLFNYHSRNKADMLTNTIAVYNLSKEKNIFKEILNANINAFAPDSFFLYNNLLVFIKDKSKVFVYELVD